MKLPGGHVWEHTLSIAELVDLRKHVKERLGLVYVPGGMEMIDGSNKAPAPPSVIKLEKELAEAFKKFAAMKQRQEEDRREEHRRSEAEQRYARMESLWQRGEAATLGGSAMMHGNPATPMSPAPPAVQVSPAPRSSPPLSPPPVVAPTPLPPTGGPSIRWP